LSVTGNSYTALSFSFVKQAIHCKKRTGLFGTSNKCLKRCLRARGRSLHL